MESAKLKRIALLLALVALAACGDDEEVGQITQFDLAIAGLEGPADVSFDDHGILHARCATDADCMRVLGYFHASHRFWQMDLQRRAARGRLATLIPIQVGMDVESRAMFSTPEGEPLEEAIWELLDDEERALIEAYAQGVNSWLADMRAGRNGARLSGEYGAPLVTGGVPELIPDWEPLDTVAFVRLMTFLLSDSSSEELSFGSAFANLAAVDPVAAYDFFTLRPGARSYTVPEDEQGALASRARPSREAVEALAARLAEIQGLLDEAAGRLDGLRTFGWTPGFGSNNWVLAPSRTASGNAILANDPHLALSNPPIFYLAHLDSKSQEGTLHVAGATFPGIPAVVIGRNERVAWGATVAFFDVTDVYVEELAEGGDAVRFDGGNVPLVRKEVEFEVAGKTARHEATLEWVPHHGPVIAKDTRTGTALTVRWVGHQPSNEIRAFLGLNRAESVADAKEALRNFEVGAQNIVLADVDGAIGWYPHAKIPSRPWASYAPQGGESLPPWMPLPGDGSAEWEGMLPEDDLPSLFDPAQGFIATANQDLTGGTESGDPTSSGKPLIQTLPAPGFRMARIVDRLEAGGSSHTVDSTHALQMDTHSEVAAVVVPALLDAAETAELSEEAERLVQVFRSWEFTCPTGLAGPRPDAPPVEDEAIRRESAGCLAFHFTLPRLLRVAFANRHREAGLGGWTAGQVVRPLVIGLERPEELMDPEGFWDDLGEEPRTRDEVLVEALERAGKEIVGPMGADPTRWLWGRVHTVTFKTEVSLVAPELDLGPFAGPGGLFTVNVANPPITGAGFQFTNGASLRIVSELGDDGVSTWLQLPGGQDLHRDSPHYGDWVERWLEGEPVRLPFTRAEVEEAAAATLRLGPAAD